MISFVRISCCWLLLCATALAHKPSDSYLKISDNSEALTAEWDIALKDLEYLLGLDSNHDSQITWGELKSKRQEVFAHALSRLRIATDHQQRQINPIDLLVTKHSDGSYAALLLRIEGPSQVETIKIHYNLLFDVDPTHRGLVFFENDSVTTTHRLSPGDPSLELQISKVSLWNVWRDYVREGIWHIWIGFDHILFLLSLLLPAVFVWKDQAWHPINTFQPAWRAVLKIVTVFTLAHSITLWLAVMEYVTLPSWLVESAIALSIVVTAYNNLHAVLPLSNWAIAFGFGLIHGFGFANVLIDLGLSSTTLAVSLFGFNVGVELGQLAIVAVFLPLAYLLRSTFFYHRVVLQFGSLLVAIVGVVWIYERLFNTVVIGI